MKSLFLATLAAALFTSVCMAQSCPVEPTSLKPAQPDIFNDQQEQWLGDAFAEIVETDLKFAPEADNVYLQALSDRLLASMPPTGLHFRIRVYESGELNAFSVGGGRNIYISRKLIAAARSEDEMAGILAHEMGHILAHQLAMEMTAYFKRNLGVTQVGDRNDIIDKVHKLLASDFKGRAPSEEGKQDVADQLAIYAMVRSGYQPSAFASAFDRITANKGKTGTVVGDFFGMTTEANRRYRADLNMAAAVPDKCMAPHPDNQAAFLAWQKQIAERSAKKDEVKEAKSILPLQDPLRSDLRKINYSPNGKYLLAQDYATVFILQREPLKVLFTVPVEASMEPHFSPDSAKLTFLTADLRVEHWDIATEKRTYLKELVIPEGCDYQELSPDGKVLVCERITFDFEGWPKVNLALWDVDQNKVIFENRNFVGASQRDAYIANRLIRDRNNSYAGSFDFSPDSHWFVAGLEGSYLVYDIQANKPVEHAISRLRGQQFAFVGNDRVVAMDGGLYSFPDGNLIKSLPMGSQYIIGVTRGDYALLRPIKDYAAGLLDLGAGKLVTASKFSAMDVYEDEVATQTPRGGLQINKLKPGEPVESIELPQSRLGGIRDAKITPDGKYLLLSTPQRSAVWSLASGKRVGLLRPYARAEVMPNDVVYFDFTKLEEKPRIQGTVDLLHGTSAEAAIKLPEKGALLPAMYVSENSEKADKPNENATLEFHDLATGELLWSKKFVHSRPYVFSVENGDRLGLWWEMSLPSDRQEIESQPELKRAMEATGDKRDGMVLQIVDGKTGNVLQTIAVKEHKPKKARDERELFAIGDYLLVEGEADNTVIYRLSTGERIGEVFGQVVGADLKSGMLAMNNRRDEVFIVDAASARELARYNLGADVRLARFFPEQKKMLVLTSEQKVYTFDEPVAATATAAVVAVPAPVSR